MGKNEIIASLKNQLKATAKENDACREGYDKLQTEKEAFEKSAQLEFQKQSEMHSGIVKQLQAQILQLQEHKDTMILTVHISGGEDIDEALDNAVAVMSKRLEKLGLQDKYNILAVPHTIGVGIVR